MGCTISRKEVWCPNIGPGQHTVELTRQIGMCRNETNEIFINGEKLVNHGYVHNSLSPLCGIGGEYEWRSEGHTFLLMFNSLAFTRYKNHRLFVDGIDVNTGLEFSAYWRHQARSYLLLGLVLFLASVLCLVCFFAIDAITEVLSLESRIRILIPLFVVGVSFIVIGIIPFCKFRRPRYGSDQMLPQNTWPSGYGINA